jgi:exonuclease III
MDVELGFHEKRNILMFTGVTAYYQLHLDYYKLTVKTHGHEVSDHFKWICEKDKKLGGNNFRVEVKESTACITSFNCNGAKNLHKVKTHCKENKPVAMGVQEIRTGNEKRLHRLAVPGYVTVSGSKDTTILVREDIRITEKGTIEGLEDLPHEFVQIEASGEKIRIVNVYCRDSQLTYTHLSILENFGKKAFILGDFNAKHRQFLTHSQKTDYNKNGETLYRYLQGDNAFEQASRLHCHNVNSPYVYTRAIEEKWVQLDLIFSHPDLIDKVDRFIYNDSLMSDHKAVSVYCPALIQA